MLLIRSKVPHSPPQSPAVPCRPLQPPTLKCLTLQGPPSSTMMAVLRFPGRVWTAFCRPVRSRALGSPPVGPCGGPGPLRTLHADAIRLKLLESLPISAYNSTKSSPRSHFLVAMLKEKPNAGVGRVLCKNSFLN